MCLFSEESLPGRSFSKPLGCVSNCTLSSHSGKNLVQQFLQLQNNSDTLAEPDTIRAMISQVLDIVKLIGGKELFYFSDDSRLIRYSDNFVIAQCPEDRLLYALHTAILCGQSAFEDQCLLHQTDYSMLKSN
jgi:hypothetical protein